MKVVILAGGYGTRLAEETETRPKPMVEIGERPVLWHIMKLYSGFGFNDFVICLGYKGYMIKEYFANYFLHQTDVTVDLKTNGIEFHHSKAEPWRITLVDTGAETMTGGRVRRVRDYTNGAPFLLTYGDGLADVDINALWEFHKKHKRLATLTAVQPAGRFGILNIGQDGGISSFMEKPRGDGAWANGGFFVMEPGVFDYIDGDSAILERDPLERLAKDGQLMAYRHGGFWQAMDTLRDKRHLEELWQKGGAPWKLWD